MIKYLFTILSLFGLLSTSYAENNILNSIYNELKKLDSFEAEFHQKTYDIYRDTNKIAEGKIYYNFLNGIRWLYLVPEKQEIKVQSLEKNQIKICTYDFILENVTIQNTDSIFALFFLNNQKNLLEKFYPLKKVEHNLLNSSFKKIIFLKAKSSENIDQLQIGVDQNFQTLELAIIYIDQSYCLIKINKIKQQKLDKAQFNCSIPKNWDAIIY